jgi:methionyl-tRNA formyltransferase
MENRNTTAASKKVIFMGTPAFATASLQALIDAGIEVCAVVTVPDKPAGRGQKMHESAVKIAANAHQIPVLQPEKLRNPDFLEQLRSFDADLFVVVAFRMLPEAVWSMPRLGTINLHASLLPQYRGAAPINHAIIQGEKRSGVTTFQLQHAIDTGAILEQQEVPVTEEMNAGDLHDKLMEVGAELLVSTVQSLFAGTAIAKPQSEVDQPLPLKEAPKLTKEFGMIDWHQPNESVYNLIRGLSPYPGAYTSLDGKMLKIYETQKINEAPTVEPGKYQTDGKNYLQFATQNGWIRLRQIQLEGKKRMGIEEFLRGYKFV